jgi:hypothetical protein
MQKLQCGGIDLMDGVFTVVETSTQYEDLERTSKSDLFVSLSLDIAVFNDDGLATE